MVSIESQAIERLNLLDLDDRHVLASAIACGANYIITDNVRDFPSEYLSGFDLEAITPDEFLTQLFYLHPNEIVRIIK